MSSYSALVQLDSDEPNEIISHHINTNARINTEQNRISPDTFDVLTANVPEHSSLHANNLSATAITIHDVDDQRHVLQALPLTTAQTSIDGVQQHQHRRHSFSDDQPHSDSTSIITTHALQTHSNHQLPSNTVDGNLINFSHTQSFISDDDDDNGDGDDDSDGQYYNRHRNIHSNKHLTSTTDRCIINEDNFSLHTADDTVEISLLGDTSMDSRESQPLLGCGRDAHDFVYNNFPGESAIISNTFPSTHRI